MNNLITINNCRIENSRGVVVPQINWQMKSGEAWLVIGPNGGGKADFINALAGSLSFVPNASTETASLFSSIFEKSVELVSLERAAKLIQEERENDESDYVEGGVDIGRTGRVFITEGIVGTIKKNSELPEIAKKIQENPAIELCGIQGILDRGLKYMSTGEIRRTLLARALISKKQLLILSDPFAGLDVQSRTILLDFFNTIAEKQLNPNSSAEFPHIILGMERWHEIPEAITNVIEFRDKKVSFCGKRSDYEQLLKQRESEKANPSEEKAQLAQELEETYTQTSSLVSAVSGDSNSNKSMEDSVATDEPVTLVEMNDVNVGWGDHKVLRNLNWKLVKGQHWLIQGPNGSGKTTFLELITGDNMQVFSNDVRLFGNRRGSGETIWDIKKRLGIVSYRLHVEYRMLGGTSLQSVIISGFRDSIGLYGAATDMEIASANKWLALGGFAGRENDTFGSLSYGEQRAILILRSAVKSPEILILDEPCHGLDEQYREKILNLMDLIGKGGTTTMLHVTHDPTEVLDCEKHILQLHPDQTPMYEIIEK